MAKWTHLDKPFYLNTIIFGCRSTNDNRISKWQLKLHFNFLLFDEKCWQCDVYEINFIVPKTIQSNYDQITIKLVYYCLNEKLGQLRYLHFSDPKTFLCNSNIYILQFQYDSLSSFMLNLALHSKSFMHKINSSFVYVWCDLC